MIPLIIVLSVVAALALVGVVVFFVLHGKKKNASDDTAVALDIPQTPKQEAAPAATEDQSVTAEEDRPAADEDRATVAADGSQAAAADENQAAVAADEHVTEIADTAESDAVRADSGDKVAIADTNKEAEATSVDKPVEKKEENGKKRRIVIKYSRSFLAKLIQSDEQTKQYYSELKNKFLLYDGVKSRVSWKCETFRKGRKTLAKLRLRGKTPSVAFALDPNNYAETEYRVESLAEIKAYATTPCLYRIKSNRRLAYAKELIEELATQNGLVEKNTLANTDYAAQYPYEETDALIQRKLIKVLADKPAKLAPVFKPSDVRESVTATEVDKIMSDEVAVSLIEKSEGKTDKTKQGIINIDTLSQNFQSGEVVTLAEIKKRVKGFNQKTTYIKVLARGTLDKPLTVEADTFSIQAVKMIVLTGGKVIKKR